MAFGILLGVFLIPVIFYTYTGILGKNYLTLDIGTFVASVILAFRIVYRATLSCKVEKYKTILYFLVFLLLICFLLFTFKAPDLGLFYPPQQSAFQELHLQ